MEQIILSPSKIATYENCPFEYYLKYVLKVRPEDTGAALGFGGAIDAAFDAYARATITNTANQVDPVALFEHHWNHFVRTNVVRYNTTSDEDSMREIGKVLAGQLPQAWKEAGFTLALDANGTPIAQRGLEVDLGNGVILRTKLDLGVYNSDGQFGIVDVKSTKTPSSESFTLMADQLTAYQGVVTVHKDALGIDGVDFLGFWEALKRNIPKKKGTAGPYINRPEIVPPRTDQMIAAYFNKARWVAASIRAGHFPRTPRMAFNTPCDLCDFANVCIHSNTSGYTFRSESDKEKVLAA